jgi:RNA polymerase sigma factor (sigma-70 family)
MDRMTDLELLRRYSSEGAEEAFAIVVRRHAGLVRGTALRQLRHEEDADEVCHAVFLALARKAGSLPNGTVVAGWLFRATRYAAAKRLRDEGRRSRREKEAAMMHAEWTADPEAEELAGRLAAHLNEALESLGARDRNAVLLRFFENRSYAEVGSGLGTSEDAAKMRVSRALEKLRRFFRKRGLLVGSTVLMSTLASQAAVAVPEQLAASVAAQVARSGEASDQVIALAEAVLRRFRWLRLGKWLGWTGAVLVIAGGGSMAYWTGGWRGAPPAAPAWSAPAMPAQQWPQR